MGAVTAPLPRATAIPRAEGGKQPAADRRAQVLEASLVVLAERGIAKMRLVDVAREAHVSVGLVQHHFGTRDALLRETFKEANRRAVAGLASVAATEPDPRRRLFAFLRYALEAPRWPVWLEYWSAAHRDATIRRHCRLQYQRWTAPFLAAIDEGIQSGQFSPKLSAQDLADRLMVLVDGLAVRLLICDPRFGIERAVELASQSLDDDLGYRDVSGRSPGG